MAWFLSALTPPQRRTKITTLIWCQPLGCLIAFALRLQDAADGLVDVEQAPVQI
jgi:hypothetical protein